MTSKRSRQVGASSAPTVLFVASIGETLKHFVRPIAASASVRGFRTIAAAERGDEFAEGFDETRTLPAFRRSSPRSHLRALSALIRIIRDDRPDVMHLNTPSAVALGRLAGVLTRTPTISVIHGTFLDPKGWRSVAFAVAEAPLAWLSKVTITANEEDASFYRIVCPRRLVQVAPGGGGGVTIDPQRIIHSMAPPLPTALYLGRFAPDKHLDLLIKSWQLARERVPQLSLRLVGGVASGDQSWVPPALPGLECAPWTDDPIGEILAASMVVSASSREGFPMVVAETIVLGVPVVAVSNRGTREISQTQDVPLYLIPKEEMAIADAIVTVASQPESIRKSRRDLAEIWGPGATSAFHVDILEKVILSRRTIDSSGLA